MVYDRIHTREIERYGGLVERMPRYALVFMVFMLASVGLPGTSGFVGEFLVLVGAFQVSTWVALSCAPGMVLGAAYMLYLYRRVIFGKLTKEDLRRSSTSAGARWRYFAPLVAMVLWMGIYPSSFIDVMAASVANVIEPTDRAGRMPGPLTTLWLGEWGMRGDDLSDDLLPRCRRSSWPAPAWRSAHGRRVSRGGSTRLVTSW